MFVCNFDGNDSDELATALVTHAPGLVEQIWGAYCLGCPDLNDLTTRDMEFVEYFRKCKLDVNFFFVAQLATDASGRDASVREILRALELKRRFADFVAANQLTPPDALKSEFQDFWKDYQSTPAPLPGSI
jgi:hypothetical protein